MADSRHQALTANTVAVVTLNRSWSEVEVINRTGSAEVYFTVNGPVPMVKGNGTEMLPAVIGGFTTHAGSVESGATVVRLISAGTPEVSVIGR